MHKIGEVVVLDGRNFYGTYFRTLCKKKSILHIFFPLQKLAYNNRNPTKNLKPSTKVKTGCHVCFG